MSRADEAELDDWIAADPRHAGAFARAMAANAYLDRAASLGVGEMAAAAPAAAPADPARPLLSRRAWIGGSSGAIAATMAAAFGLSRWTAGERMHAPIGAVRRAALDDGSAVTLNSQAEIRVALDTRVRRVRLLAGEVNFDVAKDRARPFIIDAGPAEVRVVGTSFLVRRMGEQAVAVTVREGIVEVRQGEGTPARLLAGDRLVVDGRAAPRRERLTAAEVDRLGLWQQGEIDLSGMTLAQAAREFARYSDRHIVISDPDVARLKVAGIYSTSDPLGFARAAALAQGLRAVPGGEGILLSRF